MKTLLRFLFAAALTAASSLATPPTPASTGNPPIAVNASNALDFLHLDANGNVKVVSGLTASGTSTPASIGTFPIAVDASNNLKFLNLDASGNLLVNYAGNGPTYYNAIVDGSVPADGVTDAQPALKALFARVGALATNTNPLTIVIPPGKYYIGLASANNDVVCPSNVTVYSLGAYFYYPTSLSALSGTNTEYPMMTAFKGTDVQNFVWVGGKFVGSVFNQSLSSYTSNTWLPKEGVISFNFGSTGGNGCSNCEWRSVHGLNTGGCVVLVNGINSGTFGQYSYNYNNTTTSCSDIRIVDCDFNNCGQFLWGYGWLWQILSFQSQYTANQAAMAYAYMNPTTLYGAVGMANGDTHVTFNNTAGPGGVIGVAPNNGQQYCVSFYVDSGGGNLPSNIAAGQQYFVVGSTTTYIQVSATFNGSPITFASAGSGVKMIFNITNAYNNMYLPYGATASATGGDGAWSIQNTKFARVINTTYSSPGDSALLAACTDATVADCHQTDCMMGLLWDSGCLRSTWANSTFFSTRGSRAITIEYGSTDCKINNCDVIDGRRGGLLDSPNGLTITNSKFKNNCHAGDSGDYTLGQINPATGTWYQFSCFTLLSTNATAWANVKFTGNDIVSNSPINICDWQYAGAGFIFEHNTTSGTHQSIKNEGVSVNRQTVWIGPGIGLKGYDDDQYQNSVSGVTSITIGHSCGTSVQSSNGVRYAVQVTPGNAASPAPAYATGDSSNVTLTFLTPVTGSVQYNWSIREIPY